MVLAHGMVGGNIDHFIKQLTSPAYDHLLVAHSILFVSQLNSPNIEK